MGIIQTRDEIPYNGLPAHRMYDSCVSANEASLILKEASYHEGMPNEYPRTRLSRSLKKTCRRDHTLNNTAVNESFSKGAFSGVIEQAEEEFFMEQLLFRVRKYRPMGRKSSPTRRRCFHCDHGHAAKCCLYFGDRYADKDGYAQWKHHLEKDPIRLGRFPRIPEAVSGAATPIWFPRDSPRTWDGIRRRLVEQNKPAPAFSLRRFFFPLLIPGSRERVLNRLIKKATPRQRYFKKLRDQRRKDAYKPVLVVRTEKARIESEDAVACQEEEHTVLEPTMKEGIALIRQHIEVFQIKFLARISRIKQLDESCHMEKKILKQNKNVPIGRSSSPTRRESCYHCEHQHRERCCLYIEESEASEDLLVYPRWKSYLEHTDIIPGEYDLLPEAVSAGTTPNWFPTATTTIAPAIPTHLATLQKTNDSRRSLPSLDHSPSQVFYYLTVLDELDNDLEVPAEQRPTPYQLYMQQQQLNGVDGQFPHVVIWAPPAVKTSTPRKVAVRTSPETVTASPVQRVAPPPVLRSLKPKQLNVVKSYKRVGQ
ncbi:hypothetical protein pipiens_011835 [Culex pipiens pipiens]|uniref:Uncharacterized protein n=1 Tax=Culex pipiens pipiens TaxID=38569 RepID=A0ABD1D4T9_CULPP